MSQNYRLRFLSAAFAFALAGCASAPPPPPPDTRAADAEAIRKADEAWAKAAEARNLDAWMAFYTDDAVVLPPNEKTTTGKENIRKSIAAMMELPGLSLTWQTTKTEAARSGDIGYSYGVYQMTFNDPKGKPVKDTGKTMIVWRKQPDGTWKSIVDTWNTDTPLAP